MVLSPDCDPRRIALAEFTSQAPNHLSVPSSLVRPTAIAPLRPLPQQRITIVSQHAGQSRGPFGKECKGCRF